MAHFTQTINFARLLPNRCGFLGVTLLTALLLWQTPGIALDAAQVQTTPLTTMQRSAANQVTTITESVQFERSQWQLSETEWQRYRVLMQGIRGSVSPQSLSPLEVLGIHAQTEQERKHYAKRWAQVLREDVERTLAFQRAYTQATLELYGNAPFFDEHLLASLTAASKAAANSDNNPNALYDGDRLLVFIKATACQACQVIAKQVLALSAHKKVQVDFYFTDTRESQDNPLIIAWAKQQQLEPQRLAAKTVSLNHDNGTHLKVSGNALAVTPVVYLIRRDKVQKWMP